MRVLGIDCGCERTGYGLVDSDGRAHRLIACGVIETSPKDALGSRLSMIARGVHDIVSAYSPHAAAVEEVFYAQNVKTALRLAHARGVVLCAIAEAGIALGEYSPLQIKNTVVGYGRADKGQVRMMVRSLLRLDQEIASEDANDALAVAICHATTSASLARMGAAQ
ncbi:MAG TPA: crossover junction endodeoxyribonuclease RuvC [Bryobacteraceae bacterium]|jgi:crossover junction endodeoxyribonuclease RuvC|nr:crossover junction endodeoxyribonuclease RuvC [Bryobacteraceae bacterium]